MPFECGSIFVLGLISSEFVVELKSIIGILEVEVVFELALESEETSSWVALLLLFCLSAELLSVEEAIVAVVVVVVVVVEVKEEGEKSVKFLAGI